MYYLLYSHLLCCFHTDHNTRSRRQAGILRRGVWSGASRRPPLGVCLSLPISLRSPSPILAATFSCHLAVFPTLVVLSPVASLRRSATTTPPADPLLSLLLSPLGVTPLSGMLSCQLHVKGKSNSFCFFPTTIERQRSHLIILCRVALLCLVLRRRRRLPIPCSRGFSRLSAQLRSPRSIFWPLSLSSSPRARTTLASDSHSDHLTTTNNDDCGEC